MSIYRISRQLKNYLRKEKPSGWFTAEKIADEIGCDISNNSLTNKLRRLEKHGMIESKELKKEGNYNKYKLTQKGRDLI